MKPLPKPYYTTNHGIAYLGDSREILASGAFDGKADLIMTSPPFALRRKKQYGNVEADKYVAWFMDFARLFHSILKPQGSLVIDIGGSWNQGEPTRSLYHYELLIELCKIPGHKFYLAQEFYWYNPSKLPSPAEWVTVRRERVKDAVNCIWWFSKEPHPKADNRRVLKPYSESMKELLQRGYKPQLRPSGHDISSKFNRNHNGAIPPNLLEIANTESNSRYLRACRQAGLPPNPARYPHGLPEFFIKFLTEPGDLVLDPFAGSNVTGEVCERLGRKWIAIEMIEEYLKGSKFRFDEFCIGDWFERSGQKAFLLRESRVKYESSKSQVRKKRH
ncbi:MAG: site-specific DNA-methyltransferase [Thermodesulfobacteriota bacterium]|nr:site-specific DNA-methyltransferase [Thermodesulfobacteriota bacterium]